MAGVSFDLLMGAVLFLFGVWGTGRVFRKMTLPAILGELAAGIFLGPQFLDVVPFASDGTCDTVIFPNDDTCETSSSGSYDDNATDGRRLASAEECCRQSLIWTPRWTMSDPWTIEQSNTGDIWSFAGTIGVTLLIMESGMHINFEKVKQIGGQALIVAIVGTAAPLVMGMLLVSAMWPDSIYPDGFSAGCALAPTSVGISIKLLSDAKMLNSMAGQARPSPRPCARARARAPSSPLLPPGCTRSSADPPLSRTALPNTQTTLTAAFIDDVFSLVLLVLLTSLSSGSANPLIIIGKTIGAFAFLGWGVYGGKRLYPKLEGPLSRITFVRGASIQPRDEVHLCLMLSSLVLYSWIGAIIGSHLLGAFVAGMCFVNVPRSHQVWVNQLKRIIRWLIRIFFAATVGFKIPIKQMITLEAIGKGAVLGLVPGICCKVVSGVAARRRFGSLGERQRASRASIMTRGGVVQPIQYLVGMAMVARGEFAFLVAVSARNMDYAGGEPGETMISEGVFASLAWSLVWALIFAPFLFRWALSVYQSASPIQRASTIGGASAAQRNFVIQVVGQHHSGVLHEILNAIHGEGMDVLECRVETDGEVDTNFFVVQSRGKQKDFDDEKLEDIRHHIQEILGDENAVVMFEAVDDDDFAFSAIELQVVSDSATREAHVVSHVTKRLQELGFDVEEIDEQHKVQIEHGHETEMERDLFYAVPSLTSEEGLEVTHRRVHQVKRALQSMLRDEEIKAEVVVKPVADRSKGFSELQTFDPQQAIARAKGSVWELLCFGPHDVELLSTAVRKLEPLGVRLLHAAHSHQEKVTAEGEREQCSRFFIERLDGPEPPSEAENAQFSVLVVEVLMTTYKSDKTKFTVRPVDTTVLSEMSEHARTSSESNVPGLQDVQNTPDFARMRRSLPLGLKQIPEGGAGTLGVGGGPSLGPSSTTIIPPGAVLWGLDDSEGRLLEKEAEKEAKAARRKSVAALQGDPVARIAELEEQVSALTRLQNRVARLEKLELEAVQGGGGGRGMVPMSPPTLSSPGPLFAAGGGAGGSSSTMSSLGLPMTYTVKASSNMSSPTNKGLSGPASPTSPSDDADVGTSLKLPAATDRRGSGAPKSLSLHDVEATAVKIELVGSPSRTAAEPPAAQKEKEGRRKSSARRRLMRDLGASHAPPPAQGSGPGPPAMAPPPNVSGPPFAATDEKPRPRSLTQA